MTIGQVSSLGYLALPVAVASTGGTVSSQGDVPTVQPTPVVAPATPISQNPGDINPQVLQASVNSINNHFSSFANNSVEFSVDSSSGRVVVQLVDTQTQTVLMQTPTKQALAIAQALDKSQGLLIQTKA